jgi:uncharacterized protein YceH (UPF0502 family)
MSPEPVTLPVLDPHERRVLGVLVEKAKTTPDAYPLSINALVTGSNQKSNRDPILELSEDDVEEALVRCQQKGLAIKITGGRVVRWRHALYEAWHVDKTELAVLAELLLRGPQTEGELRARASRMEPIDDLDALRAVLRPLAERRLVVYLSPEGRRGTVLTHGFHAPEELERLRTSHKTEPVAAAVPERETATAAPGLTEIRTEVAALRAGLTELQGKVAQLTEQIRAMREALGMDRPAS